MAKLNAKSRAAIPDSKFAGPGRSYPVEDKAHARAALSRVSHAEKTGAVSTSTGAHIEAMAHKELGKKSSGGHWSGK